MPAAHVGANLSAAVFSAIGWIADTLAHDTLPTLCTIYLTVVETNQVDLTLDTTPTPRLAGTLPSARVALAMIT